MQEECLKAQADRWVSIETKSMKSVKALCTRPLPGFPEAASQGQGLCSSPSSYDSSLLQIIASLAWWISPSGFAANVSAPFRELSPTVEIWIDASLDHGGGHCSRRDLSRGLGPLVSWWMIQVSTCWRLGQPENLCWPWLSLGIVSRLHIVNRTAAAFFKHQGGTRSNVSFSGGSKTKHCI